MVGVFHEGADELLSMVSRAACGLQDEGDKVDVWVPIKTDLLGSLGHVTRPGTGCGSEAWAGRERGGNDDIYVLGDAVLINLIVCLTRALSSSLLWRLWVNASRRKLKELRCSPSV